MRNRPIIFDFDGVVVDSETLANRIFSDFLTLSGITTTEAEIAARYTGMRLVDSLIDIEARHNIKLPGTFYNELHAFGRKTFAVELQCVEGADTFIAACIGKPIAIASSSDLQHITHSLEIVGLSHHFGTRVFSAANLERGKPHPDIYLMAARELGQAPETCIAIEDSPRGVRAAVAAGMFTIGLTAASHCHAGTEAELVSAGAHAVANSYAAIQEIIER